MPGPCTSLSQDPVLLSQYSQESGVARSCVSKGYRNNLSTALAVDTAIIWYIVSKCSGGCLLADKMCGCDLLLGWAQSLRPDEGPRSDFSNMVQWNTRVVDRFGDQYFAMCLAVKVCHLPSSRPARWHSSILCPHPRERAVVALRPAQHRSKCSFLRISKPLSLTGIKYVVAALPARSLRAGPAQGHP